jgi:hypothetical protein
LERQYELPETAERQPGESSALPNNRDARTDLYKTDFESPGNWLNSLWRSTVKGLDTVKELDTVRHTGPSTISIDTIDRSQGKIPEVFLRGGNEGTVSRQAVVEMKTAPEPYPDGRGDSRRPSSDREERVLGHRHWLRSGFSHRRRSSSAPPAPNPANCIVSGR